MKQQKMNESWHVEKVTKASVLCTYLVCMSRCVYLTEHNRQGLETAFSAKPYQSYVMMRKALFMPRNEPRGSKR
jgi:hypothetical protein